MNALLFLCRYKTEHMAGVYMSTSYRGHRYAGMCSLAEICGNPVKGQVVPAFQMQPMCCIYNLNIVFITYERYPQRSEFRRVADTAVFF